LFIFLREGQAILPYLCMVQDKLSINYFMVTYGINKEKQVYNSFPNFGEEI
jgi:hypothetical protein